MKDLRSRRVLVTIDTLAELMKDYLSAEDMPEDAMPVKMQLNKAESGKIGILMVSDSFPVDATPYRVNFDIKRVYGF